MPSWWPHRRCGKTVACVQGLIPTARPRSPFHTAAMPTWPPANGRGRADPLKTGDNQAHQKNDQNCEAQPK
jgi:hypothetical protein